MARKRTLPLLASLLALALGCNSGNEERFDTASESFIKAMHAIEEGDAATAMQALTASLDQLPTAEAYMERAKLYEDAGKHDEALQDCRSALEVDPENTDVQWLLGEYEKPEQKRFKGKFKNPPSSSK